MKQVFKFIKDTTSLLAFIHSLDKTCLFISFTNSLIKALIPFIYIIGGAMIVDSLLSHAYEQSILITCVMITLSLCSQLLFNKLSRIREVKGMAINRMCNGEIIRKSISLDYATFEDKKNLEEFNAADFNTGRQGGFGYFLLIFETLIEGFTSFIFASIFIVQLCLSDTNMTGKFAFIVRKEGSFLCVTLMIVLMCFVYLRLIQYVNNNNLTIYNESIDTDQKYEYFSEQMFMNEQMAKDIRLYNMKTFVYTKWKELALKANTFYKRRWSFMMQSVLTNTLINDIVLIFAYLFVLIKTIVGAISIGSFIQYIGVFRQLNQALRTTMESIGELQIRNSYLMFYANYIKKENILDTGHKPIEKDGAYDIEFHNVSFKYPNSEEYILKDVSCKLDFHHKFAIVGKNGAGKTTFIKLLCRLYEVSEGCITLNGVNIKEYDYEQYLRLFAVVFQDFELFAMSIQDNIAGIDLLDKQKLSNVLESSDVKHIIETMKDGVDTLLYHEMGDGVDVSGGQAQKIAIARALYKDSPFVVLDEPTAALDPISEYEIYEQFDNMVKNKTSIYISHRMSSCRFCDDILVFDQGRLIQRGHHEQLMKDETNVYGTLWNAQAKYYSEDQ